MEASRRRNVLCYVVVFGILVGVALAVLIPLVVVFGRDAALSSAVGGAPGLRAHLTQLQLVADAFGGNRGSLSGGFNASVAYMFQQLVGHGYQPHTQPFSFGAFTVVTPPTLVVGSVALPSSAFASMSYGGSGSVNGPLASAGTGCAGAWTGFAPGSVAIVLDGPACSSADRVAAAVTAGASALLIVRSSDPKHILTRLPGPTLVALPVLVVTNLFGQVMVGGNLGSAVRIETNNQVQVAYSSNLIAETPGGRDDSVIVVGAHLDSVMSGPGINDNGSGSAVVLQIALEMARLHLTNPVNKVRFVWFGGEENGLLGSTHYVNSLGDDKYRIAMMLNYDMLASPNYMLGIYNGRTSSSGSGRIQQVFESFAASNKYATEPTEFTGRSDYGPFLSVCPAGGLFTGAEVIKSGAQAASYGGMQNVAYDPCYHQDCDTIDNISWSVLTQTSTMAAYAVQHFAFLTGLREALA